LLQVLGLRAARCWCPGRQGSGTKGGTNVRGRESSVALPERAPNAALSVVRTLGEADLVDRSRIVMEKPFGTDLASARSLNAKLHDVFAEEQIFRIDHFLGKEPAQNILAFRFAN